MGTAQSLLLAPSPSAGGSGTVPMLAHFDGADLSSTMTNEVPSGFTLTASSSNARISTTQSVFGGASLRINNGTSYVGNSSTLTELAYGTGGFTIEFRFRLDSVGGAMGLWEQRFVGGSEARPLIYCSGTTLYLFVLGSARITASSVLAANTWYACAVSRVSGVTRMFLDGVQVGSDWTDSTNYVSSRLRIGYTYDGYNAGTTGYFDEARVTNDVGLYAGNYTPAASAFTYP